MSGFHAMLTQEERRADIRLHLWRTFSVAGNAQKFTSQNVNW